MSAIPPVKGTRDFYPQEMAFRNWLYRRIRQVSESFGYQEYEGPLLERLDLYAAKSGDELVKEQAFVFRDRGGEMVALRPELTPTLARMVATRRKSLPTPLRWWSYGPFWRYERPQKGRAREFFQWNIDLLGVESPQADAEIVAIAAAFFQATGLDPGMIRILINNRELADAQLQAIGIPLALRTSTFRLIDRRDKLSNEDWEAYAMEIGLSQSQFGALRDILRDLDAWKRSEDLVAFFATANAMGVDDYLDYDPTVIRGLDYYTGTVYEARDVAGNYRAILGGGRYDNLVADVGGDPIPATGFAMGDVVFGLVLESCGVQPDLEPNPSQVLVSTFDTALMSQAIGLAQELRSAGLRTEWYPEPARLGKQLKYADRYGIPVVAILGPDELEAGTVAIKDLRTGNQEITPRQEAASRIMTLLSSD